MNDWGDSIQALSQSLGTAVDELGDVRTWFKRDMSESKAFPPETVAQVGESLDEISRSLQYLSQSIIGIADAQNRAMMNFLGGLKLDREDFYVLLATGCIEFTNQTVGLSDFDDYELFNLLRYKSEDRRGYIYLQSDINDQPENDPDDWTMNFITRTYRKAIIPPEEIEWETLNAEQQQFFEKYLPDTVARFIHQD